MDIQLILGHIAQFPPCLQPTNIYILHDKHFTYISYSISHRDSTLASCISSTSMQTCQHKKFLLIGDSILLQNDQLQYLSYIMEQCFSSSIMATLAYSLHSHLRIMWLYYSYTYLILALPMACATYPSSHNYNQINLIQNDMTSLSRKLPLWHQPLIQPSVG